jgi:hypothetical protein
MGHLSGWDRQGGVPCLRRASFAEVATEAESGYAQAGRHFSVLTYWKYAPRVNRRGTPYGTQQAILRLCWTTFLIIPVRY